MKILGLSKYNGKKDLNEVVKYLTYDLSSSLRNLEIILGNLDFSNNFKFFSKSVSLSSGEELEIDNELKEIPSFFLVCNVSDSDGVVTKGSSSWTSSKLYVKNQGSDSLSATLLFFK